MTSKLKNSAPTKTRKRFRLRFNETTKTKQSFRDECDINNILARYQKTGVIDHVKNHSQEYGFASGDSFTESMNLVAAAKSMFEELPSQTRTKFENNPAKFLDFVQNEANIPEMREMGLMVPVEAITPPAEPEPATAPTAAPEPPKTPAPDVKSGTE